MKARLFTSAILLLTAIQQLFSEGHTDENDFLRQENKILGSELSKRVPLTDADRRTLVRYGRSVGKRLVNGHHRPEWIAA